MTYRPDAITTPSRRPPKTRTGADKGIKENINESYADGGGIFLSKAEHVFQVQMQPSLLGVGDITPATRPFQITFLLLPL